MPAAPAAEPDRSARSLELANLLARVALGDRVAFEALYRLTSAHLFAVVLRINRDRAQAEELLQEIYVGVWRAASAFDATRGQPMTWLTSVARNRAIDSLRRATVRPRAGAAPTDEDGEEADVYASIADEAPGPLELLQRACEQRRIAECMQSLSTQQQHSLALAYYDGLSHAEIAERTGAPLGTVKSWVRRALLALRRCLESVGARAPGAAG